MEIKKVIEDTCDSRRIMYRYSGSCKFKKNSVNKDRFEYIFHSPTMAIPYHYDTLMKELKKHFTIPPEVLQIGSEDVKDNRQLPIIAVEPKGDDTALKFYSWYDDAIGGLHWDRSGPIIRPIHVCTGFKWKLKDPSTYEMDTYVTQPMRSRKEILSLAEKYKFFHHAVKETLKLSKSTIKELLFNKIKGTKGTRNSYDIAFIAETIRMNDIENVTRYLADYFEIEEKDYSDLLDHLDGQFLTFIQGGIDNKGEEFLSYYYCEKDQLPENLQEIS